jgi:glyoxylase-like metal-dependent hydrolase (beta-lactamase superfamily II)
MFDIKYQPMGDYQTNCYIVTKDGKDFIIDPGVGATQWVLDNVKNPVAILNTHGHFDHIWSNKELQEELNIPLYCPKDDVFMLAKEPILQRPIPVSKVDFEVKHDECINIEGVEFTFFHFPGHTPGTSAILVDNSLFCGDFIFQNSIGRVDFPFSNPEDMKNSINKVLKWDINCDIYTGHGDPTTLDNERASLTNWLQYL